jgi:hypothetical protein
MAIKLRIEYPISVPHSRDPALRENIQYPSGTAWSYKMETGITGGFTRPWRVVLRRNRVPRFVPVLRGELK